MFILQYHERKYILYKALEQRVFLMLCMYCLEEYSLSPFVIAGL
jgi:hypothetical protein